jgi:ClpX C4-type zinc finger
MSLDNVDKDLLTAARAAGERFAAAERETDIARTEYHHAVRRLHLAGASLRDVAQALGISHQRVQQIVQANGGTWWSFVWRGRRVKPDMICSFCGLPSAQVAKLIAGPKVYICDACVGAAEQVLQGDMSKESARTRMEMMPFTSKVRCSFCGQRPRQAVAVVKKKARAEADDVANYILTHADKTKSSVDLRVVQSGDKRVCDRCLDICRRILDDRTHAA